MKTAKFVETCFRFGNIVFLCAQAWTESQGSEIMVFENCSRLKFNFRAWQLGATSRKQTVGENVFRLLARGHFRNLDRHKILEKQA